MRLRPYTYTLSRLPDFYLSVVTLFFFLLFAFCSSTIICLHFVSTIITRPTKGEGKTKGGGYANRLSQLCARDAWGRDLVTAVKDSTVS